MYELTTHVSGLNGHDNSRITMCDCDGSTSFEDGGGGTVARTQN